MQNIINFSNTTPAAPVGKNNVLWQNDSSVPPNVSAYVSNSGSTAFTQTDLTWGAAATTFGCTNVFPSTPTFTGFKHIVIRGSFKLLGDNSNYGSLRISKDGVHSYQMSYGNAASSQGFIQYGTNTSPTTIGGNNGNFRTGWNFIEWHIVVFGSNGNCLWVNANGNQWIGSGLDTFIDMSTGTFTVYFLTTPDGANGNAVNYAGNGIVETWS
jgi:hypothetical protein